MDTQLAKQDQRRNMTPKILLVSQAIMELKLMQMIQIIKLMHPSHHTLHIMVLRITQEITSQEIGGIT